MRHGDVADRLAGLELLDALDHRVGAVARTPRLDHRDVVGEPDRERVLVLAGDVPDQVHAGRERLD